LRNALPSGTFGAIVTGAGPTDRGVVLRGWERYLVVVFAWVVLVQADFDPAPLAIAVRALGWLVILAAVGVVELAMALYYRALRRMSEG
jgi:hypothetical protein